jgi:hypothetical protein
MRIADMFERAAHLQGPEIAPRVNHAHHCAGKVAFASPALAHEVAGRKGRHVYRCRTCGYYHLAGGNSVSIDRKARNASNLVRTEALSSD